MTFRVGQKVVCVDDGIKPDWPAYLRNAEWRGDAPVVGQVYTIIRIIASNDGDVLHLAEIRRSDTARLEWGYDVGYGAWRFRPIVERKTDISFAHEILRKATKPARAPAIPIHQGN